MFSGLLETGQLYLKFDEDVHEGTRLGRNMWLDGRSLAHMVENDVHEMGQSLKSCQWERVLTVLDQGQLGSCTGNAGTGALGTQPFYDAVGSTVLPDPDDEAAAEQFAVQLYSDATVVDGYPGDYPPDDTGSSGLAICKVLKSRGTIDGYRWARTAYGFLRLLQNGPGTTPSSRQTRKALSTPTLTGRLAGSPAATKSRRSPSNSTPSMHSTA
jgi:hypothetical protein